MGDRTLGDVLCRGWMDASNATCWLSLTGGRASYREDYATDVARDVANDVEDDAPGGWDDYMAVLSGSERYAQAWEAMERTLDIVGELDDETPLTDERVQAAIGAVSTLIDTIESLVPDEEEEEEEEEDE